MAKEPADRDVTIGELYPDLTAEQLREAEDNLGRYVALALRVYERIRLDPEAYARLRALTARANLPTMEGKGHRTKDPTDSS